MQGKLTFTNVVQFNYCDAHRSLQMPYYQIFAVMKLYLFTDNFLLLLLCLGCASGRSIPFSCWFRGIRVPYHSFWSYQFLSEFLTNQETKGQEYHSECCIDRHSLCCVCCTWDCCTWVCCTWDCCTWDCCTWDCCPQMREC
jgi:hypothetical protein